MVFHHHDWDEYILEFEIYPVVAIHPLQLDIESYLSRKNSVQNMIYLYPKSLPALYTDASGFFQKDLIGIVVYLNTIAHFCFGKPLVTKKRNNSNTSLGRL